MKELEQWMNKKFAEIALKLPTLVHTEPASFSCGHNMGYKQCLLDLDNLLQDLQLTNKEGNDEN